MAQPEGTEVLAELPQAALNEGIAQLVPSGFVVGDDPRTPNLLRVYQRPRERAAALLLELPRGTTPFDLHAAARELSQRGRTIVSDTWPSVTLVEHTGGNETSKFDPEHNGGWRGTSWWSIENGEAAPLTEKLVALLRAHRDADFLANLLDDTYGSAGSAVLLATYHHAFEIASEAAALAPLLRAVIARVLSDGRATVCGLGTFVCHPGPPRAIGFVYSSEPVDLDDWSSVLAVGERSTAATALEELLDRINPATDLVVPELACFSVTQRPDFYASNPRTGVTMIVPGDRLVSVILQLPH